MFSYLSLHYGVRWVKTVLIKFKVTTFFGDQWSPQTQIRLELCADKRNKVIFTNYVRKNCLYY